MKFYLSDAENKIEILRKELERINQILKEEHDELLEWQEKYSRLEEALTDSQSREAIIHQLENKIAILTTEIERLNLILKSKFHENEEYVLEIQRNENMINDYNVKLKILNQEIDRLSDLNFEHNKELESWREKYTDFENLQKKYQENLCLFVILFAEIESLRKKDD